MDGNYTENEMKNIIIIIILFTVNKCHRSI